MSKEGTLPSRHRACSRIFFTTESNVDIASVAISAVRGRSAGASFDWSEAVAIYGANVIAGAFCGRSTCDSRSSTDLRDGAASLAGSTHGSISSARLKGVSGLQAFLGVRAAVLVDGADVSAGGFSDSCNGKGRSLVHSADS